MSIQEFLTWFAMSGGSAVAVSWIAERIPQFQALSSSVKQWVMFVASTLLAIGSYALLTYVPAETLSQVAPYFAIVVSVFGTFFLNQIAHVNDPKFFQPRK